VVEVAVGVDERVERVRSPASDRLDDAAPGEVVAGVEADQASARVEQHAVRKCLDHGHAVGELEELLGCAIERIRGRVFQPVVDDAVRELQKVGHSAMVPRRCVSDEFIVGPVVALAPQRNLGDSPDVSDGAQIRYLTGDAIHDGMGRHGGTRRSERGSPFGAGTP